MEDALRDSKEYIKRDFGPVLILVLMEDALRDLRSANLRLGSNKGLNPCSNGRCSARIH